MQQRKELVDVKGESSNIMYRTGKWAYLKHDPHMERVPSVMAWNKKYRYNFFELERHHMKCEH